MPISGKLVVAVLAVPESTAGTLYGMYEVLESAGRDWSVVTRGVLGESRIRPMIVCRRAAVPCGQWSRRRAELHARGVPGAGRRRDTGSLDHSYGDDHPAA